MRSVHAHHQQRQQVAGQVGSLLGWFAAAAAVVAPVGKSAGWHIHTISRSNYQLRDRDADGTLLNQESESAWQQFNYWLLE
jgi:hypothetical protein